MLSWCFLDEEEEGVEEAGGGEVVPYNSTPPPLIKALTKDEKDKVRAVHVNMGHLPQNQMLALLKAAGAKQHEATAFCQSKKSRLIAFWAWTISSFPGKARRWLS